MLRNAVLVGALLVLAFGLICTGCNQSDTGDYAQASVETRPVASSTAPDGQRTGTPAAEGAGGGPLLEAIGNEVTDDGAYLCPVSGNEIANTPDELAKHPYVNYEGKSYYVWCPNCEAKFVSNPAGYVAGDVPTCNELGGCEAESHPDGELPTSDSSAGPAQDSADHSA